MVVFVVGFFSCFLFVCLFSQIMLLLSLKCPGLFQPVEDTHKSHKATVSVLRFEKQQSHQPSELQMWKSI